jgi:hypothetical protein
MQKRRTANHAPPEGSPRTDGSVERLRSDIDHGRTGEKVDWPDPAAAPLGTDDEAGGTPVGAAVGRAVHRAETAASSVPRQKRQGLGAAWIVIAAALIFGAVIIGFYLA